MANQEMIRYVIDDQEFTGQLFYPPSSRRKHPLILVAPAWRGLDQFAKDKAQQITDLGYLGFAIDVYGQGKEVNTDEEAAALMMPLFKDRALLQKRVKAAFETIRYHPAVESSKIGGIGFCFGGLAIIELLRSGVDIRGVVSFHAVLGNKMGDQQAQTISIAQDIKGSLLMLQGFDDPLVSNEDVLAIEKEMTKANVDWQFYMYGHAAHAFTNPEANDPNKGLIFNPEANRRSWQAMCDFFQEVFS